MSIKAKSEERENAAANVHEFPASPAPIIVFTNMLIMRGIAAQTVNDTLYQELEQRYGAGFAQWVADRMSGEPDKRAFQASHTAGCQIHDIDSSRGLSSNDAGTKKDTTCSCDKRLR